MRPRPAYRPDGPHTQATRCVRVLRALEALPALGTVTVARLAAQYRVSVRTMRRDLAALRAASEPVQIVAGRVWRGPRDRRAGALCTCCGTTRTLVVRDGGLCGRCDEARGRQARAA